MQPDCRDLIELLKACCPSNDLKNILLSSVCLYSIDMHSNFYALQKDHFDSQMGLFLAILAVP